MGGGRAPQPQTSPPGHPPWPPPRKPPAIPRRHAPSGSGPPQTVSPRQSSIPLQLPCFCSVFVFCCPHTFSKLISSSGTAKCKNRFLGQKRLSFTRPFYGTAALFLSTPLQRAIP